MTDLTWLPPTLVAVGVILQQWRAGKAAEADRAEAKAERAAAAKKLEAIGEQTGSIEHKVDGAHTLLVEANDALRADKAALKTEVVRRDQPGALPTNESAGPVSIDSAGAVQVEGENRRRS